MKPTTTPTEPALPLVNACCCGIDVHKDAVVVCIRLAAGPGGRATNDVRTFGTTTKALLELADWLAERCVTSVAMESTGVYWKPVWNLLEGRANADGEAIALMLVNARHMRNVPERKTDVKDGPPAVYRRGPRQWIAQLLAAGLLSPSFVPERPQRELRDLTRQRAQLVGDKARFANRLQKVLEDANVKLASVASDVLGVSGRHILRAMLEGKQTPAQMAELAKGALRRKIPALAESLKGGVNDHHRFMLKALLEQVEGAERQIAAFDQRIEQVMPPLAREAVERLDAIPGLDKRAAQNILAEIGTDMSRFPTAGHLASWAGLCPGNNESAGKRRSGRTTEGDKWLKRTMSLTAWAAARTKGSYFQAQHRRLAKRRGPKRATMAVAHSQLCTIYAMLKNGTAYADLGAGHFEHRDADRLKGQLVNRLQRLGFKVTIEPAAAA